MATTLAPIFNVQEFLAEEREKDLFRFSTAGSVDDGKSTLIGRLLYDTQSVYDDQVKSIQGKGTTAPGQIDFALLTDGLRAEREQGITIDVAYRYFSTARRKFIIADTPGHEQYTRNMATGASTADATVVLIDASKGVLVQSRRHAFIASLLRVPHIVVAVNKMDLIGYGEEQFRAIASDFTGLLDRIAADTGNAVHPIFVPVSALLGDNIVVRANTMPWYHGPTLLEVLEALPSSADSRSAPFRFPVQRVLRPDAAFRGFAGQIASGTIRPGDSITVHPSGRGAQVARIVTWDGDLAEAHAPLSVTLVLDRELDISRGDLIVASETPATMAKSVKAALVWMDARPLDPHRRYLLKHTSQTVPAYVSSLQHRTDIGTLERESADTLEMNGIGVVALQLLRPIALELYCENRSTGAFILIDTETNSTVAAGMVIATGESAASGFELLEDEPLSVGERADRWGHRGAAVAMRGPARLINAIERSLFNIGAFVGRVETDGATFQNHAGLIGLLVQSKVKDGMIALVVTPADVPQFVVRIDGADPVHYESRNASEVIAAVHQLLAQAGILHTNRKAAIQ